ncbi:LysR substrate-binding domain-containing protein, partial [Labrys sp. KB_33_2]|uniref:LysR substrate-binding domain-containing protein n=1 Tax=Labrys sp. KB_33_2 TaxID=3237479 RepID=UPI003F8EE26E
IAKRVGPIHGKLVASPDYIEVHGSPGTPGELAAHQALMQGTEAWQFMDGDKIVTVQPQGRFKADSATALAAAAAAGLGIAWLPDCITHKYVASGALVSRIAFQMSTASLETAAMKRSIELLGTEVAPIGRAVTHETEKAT